MPKLKFELKITGAYLLAGGLWIIFSDKLLYNLIKDINLLSDFQTYKGWFYVFITSILFYSLLENHLKKLRKAEFDARESDRLKTAFLQNISHEIRTPMNGIIGFAQLMAEEDMDENQQKEFTQIIVKSSNRLLSIVNDVLEISLIESGKIEAHNNNFVLNELMDELFREFGPSVGKDVSFSVNKTLSDELSSITTDEIKLRQTIYNLLSNANKFTENGHIEFGYHLKNEKLEFYVEDTGIGIKQEQQETIFNRFVKFESKLGKLYEGTGLGLAICKGYIKILNGEMWLKSQQGIGSTFYFTIPYVRTKQLKNILRDKSKIEINKKITILVIEDDETNLEYLNAIFSNSDFSLISARNGKEALSVCMKEKKIDLILLDLKLPDMSGYEVLEGIKEMLPDIPVIAQTAFAMYEEKKQMVESGFTDIISKPFKKDQLLSVVNKNLPDYQPLK